MHQSCLTQGPKLGYLPTSSQLSEVETTPEGIELLALVAWLMCWPAKLDPSARKGPRQRATARVAESHQYVQE